MAKFLLQSSACAGTYRNPFKEGGTGLRFTPWRTVGKHNTLEEAKQAWLTFNASVGMRRRRIVHKSKVLVNDEGRMYELREFPSAISDLKTLGLVYVGNIGGINASQAD